MSALLFAFWIKNEISSSGTWCVHTINIQITLLRCYVLRVRKKIPHTLYIQELHMFSRFWLTCMSNEGNTRFTFPGKIKESEAIMVLVIIYTSKDVRRIQTWNSVKFPSLISIMPYVHVPGTGSKSDQGQIMTDRYHWRRKMFCIGGADSQKHRSPGAWHFDLPPKFERVILEIRWNFDLRFY